MAVGPSEAAHKVGQLARRVANQERAPATGVADHSFADHSDTRKLRQTADGVWFPVYDPAEGEWELAPVSGGGMVSLLKMSKTSAQVYFGGLTDNVVLFNVTDPTSFGTGLAYDSGSITITENGWYQALGKLSTTMGSTGHEGPIRVALERPAGNAPPFAVGSTWNRNNDTWLSAASDPFYVGDGFEEIQLLASHDVAVGGVGTDIDDLQDGLTSLSVWRIA